MSDITFRERVYSGYMTWQQDRHPMKRIHRHEKCTRRSPRWREGIVNSRLALLLVILLLAVLLPGALAEGLETEEGRALCGEGEIVLSADVDDAPEEEEIMLLPEESSEAGGAGHQVKGSASVTGIPIDEAHFPDANFRKYVSGKCDKNGNGELSGKEIARVTDVVVSAMSIGNLKGIELFTNLQHLDCACNELEYLDVSKNTALIRLDCEVNNLKSLDVTKNTALEFLCCSSNKITGLNASGNASLKQLDVSCNRLADLDVRGCTVLETLKCEWNKLISLDVIHNPGLVELSCQGNRLISLDLSNHAALSVLICTDNQFETLDVSKCPSLTVLSCFSNRLTALDVSNNPALETLICAFNRLKRLDVSKNPALKDLHCEGNLLTRLDLSKNGNLLFLECYGNEIKSLDLSNCGAMLKQLLQNDPDLSTLEDLVWIEAEDLYSLYFDCLTTLTVDGRTIHKGAPVRTNIAWCDCSIKDKTWTGSKLKPAVTVKDSDKVLVKGTDYTVAYFDNRDVGIAVATIDGKGNYTGSVNVTFRIRPRGTALSKLTGGSKKITVKWQKQTEQVTGYQIQYGTKRDFSNARKLTVKGAKTTRTVIRKLKAKKTYYVRIRTYKTVEGQKIYSTWSKSGKIKTK